MTTFDDGKNEILLTSYANSIELSQTSKGEKGEPGEGVLPGGSTGQVLAKASDADFDTEWVDQSGGGGGSVNSVNGKTGTVVLDPDDLDDASTSHKFATATELTDISLNTAARHTHANKPLLDATTASFTSAQETKLAGIEAGAQVNPSQYLEDVTAGTNVTIDKTDPKNPVISATGGGGGGQVDSITPGNGIDVDATDPVNPEVSLDSDSIASLGKADTALQPGDDISELTNDAGYTSNAGTVTSVGVSVPTGLSVSGSPVTSSGTVTISHASGYQAYTSDESSKLAGIEAGAEVNPSQYLEDVIEGDNITIDKTDPKNPIISAADAPSSEWGDITGTLSDQTDLKNALDSKLEPGDNVSELNNDAGYTTNAGTVTSVGVSVPTGLSVSGSPVTSSGTVTITHASGYQAYTSAEASKLSGIASGAEVNVQADWNQSNNTADDYIKNKPALATVATTGSYDDLDDKPTIPAAQVNSDWNAVSGVEQILNKPTIPSSLGDLSDVDVTGATTGEVLTYDGSEWKPASGGGGGHDYLHTQASASATWNVAHNLDDENPVVSVKVSGEIVEPQSIAITDADNIVITFGSSVSGTAKIMTSGGELSGGPTPEEYAPNVYVYLPDYKPQTEIDAMISGEIATNGKMWGVFWENFRFNSAGDYIFVDTSVSGGSNMGFSSGNKARVLNVADNVLVGVAGDISGSNYVTAMLANSTKRNAAIAAIAAHVDAEGFQGVNINFEPIPDLSGTKLTNFRTFVTDLKAALVADNPNALLSFAGHIIWDSDVDKKEFSGVNYTGETTMTGTNYMAFTLNDIEDMGFDIIEMQAYDQFYDFGIREFGITSYDQVGMAIDFADRRVSHDKISIIIGSYGVRVPDGDEIYGGVDMNNMTRSQVLGVDATFYSTATRQSGRGYLIKSTGSSKQVIAADQKTVDVYYRICKNKRLKYIGFWLAGDYPYPSKR